MNESSSEFESSKAPSGRTQWHRILGALLELLLTRLGIIVQSEVQVMSDPPKVDIVLLRREGSRADREYTKRILTRENKSSLMKKGQLVEPVEMDMEVKKAVSKTETTAVTV